MTSITQDRPAPIPAGIPLATAAWGAAVVAASSSSALGALAKAYMPAYALLVALGIAVPTALYFSLPTVRRAVDAIGLRRLTLFHAWRIPAGALFLYYAATGGLPLLFGIVAGVGDILAGIAAATLAGRDATRAQLRRIHLFGFADFITAVGTGLTFTLLGNPLMATLTTLPMALIPLFGVGLSGASHIVALNALRRA
ncbi:MAG: hypothetical protein U1F41_17895 [Burkholderiales bacterium]